MAKKGIAFRVAAQRLSALHPSVFGVSLLANTLTTIHAASTHHDRGDAACQRQIYIATSAANASASARYQMVPVRPNALNSPIRSRRFHAALESAAAHS